MIQRENGEVTIHPDNLGIPLGIIVNIINERLPDESDVVELNDPRLTNEFLQELVNDWYPTTFESGGIGEFWTEEDAISEKWYQKILNQFGDKF